MKNRPELHKGFTLLEVVIAIIIVSAISVAAVSSILALRSLSNGYYQRLLAFNQLDNVSTCVEMADGEEPDAFLTTLREIYGEDWKNNSVIYTYGDDGKPVKVEIYYDAGFRPSPNYVDETVFCMEIRIDATERQRIVQCTVRDGSDPEPDAAYAALSDLAAVSEKLRTTEYTVLETREHDDEGNETLTYTIGGETARTREEIALYADALLEYPVHRSVTSRSETADTPRGELTQAETRNVLSRCFGLDGELRGTVLLDRQIAAYRLRIYRLDGNKTIAQSERVIRRALTELDEYGEPYAHQGIGLDDGIALGFSGGNGSAEHPFLISNAAELRAMGKLSQEMRPVSEPDSFAVLDAASGAVYAYGGLQCFYESDSGSYVISDDTNAAPLLRFRVEADGRVTVTLPETVTSKTLSESGIRIFLIPSAAGVMALPDDLTLETAASLADAECRMLRHNYYHFLLTASIDLSGCEGTICSSFCGVFDGDGYQLYGGEHDVCLFGTISADSIVSGFDLVEANGGVLSVADSSGIARSAMPRRLLSVSAETDGESGATEFQQQCTSADVTPGDEVLFENISVYGMLRTGDGEGPFVREALARRTTFRRCLNFADMISDAQEGCAIYVTARWGISADLVFEDCKNFGTVFGDHAALFVACSPRGAAGGAVGEMSVMNSCSFGRIIGRKSAGYVYGCEDSFAFEALFGSYTPADGTGEAVASVAPTLLSALPELCSIVPDNTSETPDALCCKIPAAGVKSVLVQMQGTYYDAAGELRSLLVWRKDDVTPPGAAPGEDRIEDEDEAEGETETESEPEAYSVSLAAVRFLDEASAAARGATLEEIPGETGRDRHSGAAYRAYTASWTEEAAESAEGGEPLPPTEHTECWYVFTLEDGAAIDFQADLMLMTLGEDDLGLGGKTAGEQIGYSEKALSFAL